MNPGGTMTTALFAALLAFSVTVVKATVNVSGTMFTRADLDDMTFTGSFRFRSAAASLLSCANLCALDPSCLSFTFHPERSCHGYDSSALTSSSNHSAARGAQTYSKETGEQDREQWTVVLRRQDGSVDFYRNWSDYREGFGNTTGEFWMGLEPLYQMTSQRTYLLTVELEDWEGNAISAHYANFSVSSGEDCYRLSTVVFLGGAANDSLDYHIGQRFSTSDVDNDGRRSYNCAQERHGAWWYQSCAKSNLCGRYYNYSSAVPDKGGISWKSWTGNNTYSLKSALMKIRPAD